MQLKKVGSKWTDMKEHERISQQKLKETLIATIKATVTLENHQGTVIPKVENFSVELHTRDFKHAALDELELAPPSLQLSK